MSSEARIPDSELSLPIRPDAVSPPDGSVDFGVPWHYGDPHGEQRRLSAGLGAVDLSHRGVVRIGGRDRLSWLHDLTTQHLVHLQPGESTLALILDPHGHVEHELHLVDDGTAAWATVEPGRAPALAKYLDSMRFLREVEVRDVSRDYAAVWRPRREADPVYPTWLIAPEFAGTGITESGADRGGDASRYVARRPAPLVGSEVILPRSALAGYLRDAGEPAGTWALEALRVAAGVPRLGLDTDHKALPHEVGWIGPGVHLAKGCYRGQETVARLHNMGRPPRRLVLLHLDGSAAAIPEHGDEVLLDDRVIGWVGSVALHYELGPIATGMIKRSTPAEVDLTVRSADGSLVAASQEPIVSG